MWLLKKTYTSFFLLPFFRRITFDDILPLITKTPIIKCSGHQYITNKLRKIEHILSYNVLRRRMYYCFKDFQNYFFLEQLLRFKLMMIVSPHRCAYLTSLENESINGVMIFCDTNFQCKEKMYDIAKECWLKGNIVTSFDHFSSLYDQGNKVFQTRLIKILQDLICVSVEKDGMAIVTNIIDLVKKFSYEKNELSVLMTLWYALFNSSLYDDNCLSDTLLEDLDFRSYLEPFIPYFGANFLKHNEVRSYQRLIETSLTHNMDNAAGILLRLLFDYYYKTGYASGCSAVYECCIDLDIKLTKDQIYKFNLLRETGVKMKNSSQKINHPKDLIYKF